MSHVTYGEIRPLRDKILVKKIDKGMRKTAGGIILPQSDSAGDGNAGIRPRWAQVYAVGSNIDYGAVFTGYIGLALAGAVYTSVGTFASSLTDNQVVAFIIGIFIVIIFFLMFSVETFATADSKLVHMDVDLSDQQSLQRGAKIFVNYCLSCHSAKYMRYNRMGSDLSIKDQVLKENLFLISHKIHMEFLFLLSNILWLHFMEKELIIF